jgi:hypothetical protein
MPIIGSFFSILAAIVAVAALTVFLSSTNTANIIKNLFDGLSGSLRASMGR